MSRWIVAAFPLLSPCLAALAQAAPDSYAVGSEPAAVVRGDFDNDGHSDLAVANSGSGTVSVLLGNGDGTFQAAVDSSAGSNPRSLVAGDLDGDGNTDLVLIGGSLHVLLGNGDGTFQAPSALSLPAQSPPGYTNLPQSAVETGLGDLDGDGDLDLVVAGATAAYEIVTYCGYYGCWDYWTLARLDGFVNVLLGVGDGTFGPVAVEHVGLVSQSPRLALGDFDGDGQVDVVLAGVRLGNGDGTFQSAIQPAVGAGTPGDFDGDGNLDMLIEGGNSAVVLRGSGDGTFQATDSSPFSITNHLECTAIGDVDDDGKVDLVAVGGSTQYTYCYYYCYDPVTTRSAAVLRGHGDGTFGPSGTWDLDTFDGWTGSNDAVLTDLDGDGLPELAVTNRTQGVVVVAHNGGNWPAPAPFVRIDDVSVTEGDSGTTPAVFTVHLSAPFDQDVDVNFSAQPSGGSDILATSGTVHFAAGDVSKTISVAVIGDRLYEGNRSFSVVLSNATHRAVIADAWASGLIVDNDPRIDVRINDVARLEGKSGSTAFAFNVTLSSAYVLPVTVYFYTVDGSAKATVKKGPPADYTGASGSVTFAAGETAKTVSIAVDADRKRENDETFFVQLSYAVNAYVVDGSGLGTILNDD